MNNGGMWGENDDGMRLYIIFKGMGRREGMVGMFKINEEYGMKVTEARGQKCFWGGPGTGNGANI